MEDLGELSELKETIGGPVIGAVALETECVVGCRQGGLELSSGHKARSVVGETFVARLASKGG